MHSETSAHASVANDPPETGLGASDATVGTWEFLGTQVLFFTGLIGSYVILRFGAASTWPAPGEVLNVPITAINTFILICSSVSMVKAFAAVEEGDQRGTSLWLLATFAMGAAFLGVQVYEYAELIGHDFLPSSGLYGSTFFTMTGFHGFHVFLGLCCLGFTTVKAFRGGYSAENHRGVEVLGLYWHFVDLVWIILFTIVYLI
jgi:heme/copper-type cytochrome/quinol oxidase subunit 3